MREPRSKQPKQEAYESRVWQLKDSLFWLTSKLLALAWKMFGNIPCSAATSQSLELCFAPAQGDHLLLAALGLRQMATHMQIARRRTARLFVAGVDGVAQNNHGSPPWLLELVQPPTDRRTLQSPRSSNQMSHVTDTWLNHAAQNHTPSGTALESSNGWYISFPVPDWKRFASSWVSSPSA